MLTDRPGPDGPGEGPDTTIVVPCYNEADRLDLSAFTSYVSGDPQVRFLFVDDGSTDSTRAMLEAACHQNPARFELLTLDTNRGKAEAVRLGILRAAASRPAFVGFWDADLATPLDELPRFRAVFDQNPRLEIVLGSRVNLLGRQIHRQLVRHYVSRLFATLVAAALRLPVYDTQCGAKVYRCTDGVIDLFREPFHATWIFDAEILVRAIHSTRAEQPGQLADIAYELPLMRWEDMQGSKIRARHLLGAGRDAVRIYGSHIALVRWQRGSRGWSFRFASLTREFLKRLATDEVDVSTTSRVRRAAPLVPVFGALQIWSRIRSWFIGPVELVATTTAGWRFGCRFPDFIQTYLFLFGVWEPDLSAFISRRLEPGDTFVDVGANIGYHTLLAHSAVGSTGRVVAIEASPTTLQRLQRTLECNGSPASIRTVHAAAADRHGLITMYQGPEKNVGLSTTVAGRGFVAEAQVPCAPLSDLVLPAEIERLRLVKIDVEGGEDAVVQGLGDLLEDAPPDVEFLIELSPRWWSDGQRTPRQVLAPFVAAGFHIYEIDNNLWPWRYLWPNDVRPPRRLTRDLSKRPKRLDLVLSRVDAKTL